MEIKPIDISELKKRPNLHTVYQGFIVDNTYRVLIANMGGGFKGKHMRIKRLDDLPISSFTDMQNLKNQFFGEEVEAIQVFPKVSNYVDLRNTYHIFTWDGIKTPNLKEMYDYSSFGL